MSEEKQYIITESQMNTLTTTLKAIYKTKKRKAKEVVKEEKEEPNKAVKTEEWVCSGRVWEDPPGPCTPNEKHPEYSTEKCRIIFNKKRVVVCKECKLEKTRQNNRKRKQNKNE